MTDKILIGGVERGNDFRIADRNHLLDHMLDLVKNAVASVPPNRLIVAPGCTVPSDIPEFRLNLLKEAMDTVCEVDGQTDYSFHLRPIRPASNTL